MVITGFCINAIDGPGGVREVCRRSIQLSVGLETKHLIWLFLYGYILLYKSRSVCSCGLVHLRVQFAHFFGLFAFSKKSLYCKRAFWGKIAYPVQDFR